MFEIPWATHTDSATEREKAASKTAPSSVPWGHVVFGDWDYILVGHMHGKGPYPLYSFFCLNSLTLTALLSSYYAWLSPFYTQMSKRGLKK